MVVPYGSISMVDESMRIFVAKMNSSRRFDELYHEPFLRLGRLFKFDKAHNKENYFLFNK